MYEARRCLLGLESSGVSVADGCSIPHLSSPALTCPVGLDILASTGLGLTSLGNYHSFITTHFVKNIKGAVHPKIYPICLLTFKRLYENEKRKFKRAYVTILSENSDNC